MDSKSIDAVIDNVENTETIVVIAEEPSKHDKQKSFIDARQKCSENDSVTLGKNNSETMNIDSDSNKEGNNNSETMNIDSDSNKEGNNNSETMNIDSDSNKEGNNNSETMNIDSDSNKEGNNNSETMNTDSDSNKEGNNNSETMNIDSDSNKEGNNNSETMNIDSDSNKECMSESNKHPVFEGSFTAKSVTETIPDHQDQIPTASKSTMKETSHVKLEITMIESNGNNAGVSYITKEATCSLPCTSSDSSDLSKPSTSKLQDETSQSETRDLKRPSQSTEVAKESIKKHTMEPEFFKRRKVDIYVEDNFPKWYNAQGNLVTRPILPKKLPELYDFLPIFGAPKSPKCLKEFQNNKIREFVGGLNDEEFNKLAQYCSPYHLKTGKELTMLTNIPSQGLLPRDIGDVPNDELDELLSSTGRKDNIGHELCIVRKCKMRTDRDATNNYSKRLKYRGVRLMPLSSEGVDTKADQLEPGKDVLIRVRIYRPFPYNTKDYRRPNRGRPSIFSRDLYLLGRHTLEDLRDRIVCPNDVDMRVDMSERPHCLPTTCSKDVFPSGFLFINNKFYVDARAGCTDHTERLRRWAVSRQLGVFPRADMHSAVLQDLPIKLGHPEVYVHQGNCEHLFTFSEIRLLNASDPLKPTDYPCHTAVSQNQTVYCTTCAEFGAKWIVVGCPRVPFDPAFFCDTCLKLYLYKDGKKIGNFKAYYYRGNEINMLKPQG